MPANGIAGLVGNFLQAFAQSKMMGEDRADKEAMRKAQTKLFELQLKQEQARQSAMDKVSSRLSGLPLNPVPQMTDAPGGLGLVQSGSRTPQGARMTLSQMLANPEMTIALAESGAMGNFAAMNKMQMDAHAQEAQSDFASMIEGGGMPMEQALQFPQFQAAGLRAGMSPEQLMARSQPNGAQSPIGKMLDDMAAYESKGDQFSANILRTVIDKELAAATGDEVNFDDMRNVRNDFIKVNAPFMEQQKSFQSLQAAANDPSPAGDLAIAYGFLKILDPGSIVREGEVQLTADAGSLAQRVAGDFKRVFSGERLTDGQREDFILQAGKQFKTAEAQYMRSLNDARDFATRHGLQFEDIVPEQFRTTGTGGSSVNLGGGVTVEFLD